jgi:predicted transposase YbfD/YdcC
MQIKSIILLMSLCTVVSVTRTSESTDESGYLCEYNNECGTNENINAFRDHLKDRKKNGWLTDDNTYELRQHFAQRQQTGWKLSEKEKNQLKFDDTCRVFRKYQRKELYAFASPYKAYKTLGLISSPEEFIKMHKKHHIATQRQAYEHTYQMRTGLMKHIPYSSFIFSTLLWFPEQIYTAYLHSRSNPWIQTGPGTYMRKDHISAKSLHDAWVIQEQKKLARFKPTH